MDTEREGDSDVLTQAMTDSRDDPIAVVKSLSPLIDGAGERSEKIATMTPEVLQALKDAGLFQLFVPAELGGGNADAVVMVKVIEEISRADPSAGWSYMANAYATAALAASCTDAAVQEIFGASEPPIGAGSENGKVVARRVDGGYVVSGQLSFVSGGDHASWLVWPASVEGEESTAPSFSFAAPRAVAELRGNWDVHGLCGTGSFDFGLTEHFVAEHFILDLAKPQRGQPSLRIFHPALVLSAHLGVALGTAKRALEDVVAAADSGKQRRNWPPIAEQQLFRYKFAVNEAKFMSARAYALEAVKDCVDAANAGQQPTDLQSARVRQSVVHAVHTALEVVEFSYVWAGSRGLRRPNALGRITRDMLAQNSHHLVDDNVLVGAAPFIMTAYRGSA